MVMEKINILLRPKSIIDTANVWKNNLHIDTSCTSNYHEPNEYNLLVLL